MPAPTRTALALFVACSLLLGCATAKSPASQDAEVYRRAEIERADYLAREVQRLRADLERAEKAMVDIESGLRGSHSRADAVSAIAEARIAVERAADRAPWRDAEAAEARAKLDEAERQVQDGHFGSAVFFADRATGIARTISDEVRRVERSGSARFVRSERLNLRSGPSTVTPVLEVLTESTPVFPERAEGDWLLVRTPSGRVGWVHASLVRAQPH